MLAPITHPPITLEAAFAEAVTLDGETNTLKRLLPEVGGPTWAALVARALDDAVYAAPAALLENSGDVREVLDSGAGVETAGARVLWARRSGRLCQLRSGNAELHGALSGLNRATAFRPVCAVTGGSARVLPDGGHIAMIGPYMGRLEVAEEGTPMPPLHPLVVAASVASLRVLLLETVHGAASVTLETDDPRAAIPTIPALDLSGIPVPSAPPDVPDLTPPVLGAEIALPADYATFQAQAGAFLTSEDSELAQSTIAEQRAVLEEWATGVNNQVARFRAQVDAFLAEPRVYEATVSGYRATVEAYAARVSAAVQAHLAEHVQGALAVFRVREEVRQADLGRILEGLARALQMAVQERDRRFTLLSVGGDPAALLALQAQAQS